MTEYIEREAAIDDVIKERDYFGKFSFEEERAFMVGFHQAITFALSDISSIPAADVRPVVTCADCKYNNACLTQAFVEEASRVPFDRNTFFCSDGKRCDDA